MESTTKLDDFNTLFFIRIKPTKTLRLKFVLKINIFNPLSTNPTKWSNTLFANKLFECVRPFCDIGTYKIKAHAQAEKYA